MAHREPPLIIGVRIDGNGGINVHADILIDGTPLCSAAIECFAGLKVCSSAIVGLQTWQVEYADMRTLDLQCHRWYAEMPRVDG